MPLQVLLKGSNVSKTSKVRSITRMNRNTLQAFRHGMYHCFGNAKDALFNLVDALSSEAGASSFPELSFSPFFERTWASLYEALEDGQIDAERLRQAGELVCLVVNTSYLYSPETVSLLNRMVGAIKNVPKKKRSDSPGWVI